MGSNPTPVQASREVKQATGNGTVGGMAGTEWRKEIVRELGKGTETVQEMVTGHSEDQV